MFNVIFQFLSLFCVHVLFFITMRFIYSDLSLYILIYIYIYDYFGILTSQVQIHFINPAFLLLPLKLLFLLHILHLSVYPLTNYFQYK